MKEITLILALALLAAPATAENRFSVEGVLGSTKHDYSSEVTGNDNGNIVSGDYRVPVGTATLLGIRGGLQFGEFLAIEAGIQDHGEITTSELFINFTRKTVLSSRATTLGVKGIWPISNTLSLNARAGVADWSLEGQAIISGDTQTYKYSKSDRNIYYATGLDYKINDAWFIGLTYFVLDMTWSSHNDIAGLDASTSKYRYSADSIALSLGRKF